MKSGIWSLLFLVMFSVVGLQAEASVASVKRAYYGCMKFLTLSRAQQMRVAARTSYSYKQTLWACQLLKRNGLEKSIHLDGQYEQWQRDSAAASRSSGSSSTSSPRREEEHRSSSLTSGSCYPLNGCNGTPTHTNIRVSCPAGTDSFKPDIGGSCESY